MAKAPTKAKTATGAWLSPAFEVEDALTDIEALLTACQALNDSGESGGAVSVILDVIEEKVAALRRELLNKDSKLRA